MAIGCDFFGEYDILSWIGVDGWFQMKVLKNFKFDQQWDSISCGPACMSMLGGYIESTTGKKNGISHRDWFVMAGTNDEVGTVPDGVRTAFRGVGIRYEFKTADENEKDVKKNLKESIDAGRPVMIRSLIYGIKHWQIVIGYDGSGVLVMDPAIGTVFLKWNECLDRMRARGWDRFVVDPTVPMRTIAIETIGDLFSNRKLTEFNKVVDICWKTFEPHGATHKLINEMTLFNMDTSPVVMVDGEPVGVYVVGDASDENWLRLVRSDLRATLKEMQLEKVAYGLAFAVSEEHRRCGYGRLLREYPRSMGFEAIIGEQMRSLNNLDDWLKRRFLVDETASGTTTMEIYGKPHYSIECVSVKY